jgi:hypothetical protein
MDLGLRVLLCVECVVIYSLGQRLSTLRVRMRVDIRGIGWESVWVVWADRLVAGGTHLVGGRRLQAAEGSVSVSGVLRGHLERKASPRRWEVRMKLPSVQRLL